MCTQMMGMMSGGMAAWMAVWTVLLLGLLAFGTTWLVRRGLRPADRPRQPALEDTPTEILRRRYAAGEIDEDEYLIRLSGISQR